MWEEIVVKAVAYATSAATILKSATGAAADVKALSKTARDPAVYEQTLRLYDLLMEARDEQFKLQDALRQVQEVLRDRDSFDAIASLYKLEEMPGGASIYVLAETKNDREPYLCPNCFTTKAISYLQPESSLRHVCPRCRTTFQMRRGSGGLATGWDVTDPQRRR